MSNEKGLAVIEGQFKDVQPLLTPEDAKAAKALYREIVDAVTDADDYQTFRDSDGKQHKFRKRSGWKWLQRFYGVSAEIRREQPIHEHNPAKCLRVKMPEAYRDVEDCGCPVKGWRVIVRAVDLRSGRYSENIGICVNTERRVSNSASQHDLATRAFNRGANRAVADLLGVSDPSAEDQQAISGFSKEERQLLSGAFKAAAQDRQNAALLVMEEATGLDESTDREVYIGFLKKGTDAQLERVYAALAGTEADFDPDDVPMGEK